MYIYIYIYIYICKEKEDIEEGKWGQREEKMKTNKQKEIIKSLNDRGAMTSADRAH